jgi:hypothetical protein
MTREDRLTTLELLWAAWEQQGRALSAEQWQQPTRLGDWTVRMLYAHAAGWPVGFSHLVGQVREVAPTHASAAGLLGDFNRPGGIATSQADLVAAAAREHAATYTPAQLIEQFTVTGPQAIATARQLGPVVVDYLAGPCCPWRRRSASASWKPPSTCWICSAPSVCRPMCHRPVWSTQSGCWPR